jgi:hypothetical protein
MCIFVVAKVPRNDLVIYEVENLREDSAALSLVELV